MGPLESHGKPLGLDWGRCFGDTHVHPGCSSAARPEGSECHYCGLTCSPNDSLQLVIASLVKVEVSGKSRWDGATQHGERPTQELPSPPPAASSGASQTTALPEVFTELTTVMLTVTIYYRNYRGSIQMHQGRAHGMEAGNQPDAGLLCLCSSWSQDGGQHEQSIDHQDAPLASVSRDFYWAWSHRHD